MFDSCFAAIKAGECVFDSQFLSTCFGIIMPQRTFSQGSDHYRDSMQVFFSIFTFSDYIMYSSIFNSPAVCQCFLKLHSCRCACNPLSVLLVVTLGGDRGPHVFNTHVAGLAFQTRVIERDPVM